MTHPLRICIILYTMCTWKFALAQDTELPKVDSQSETKKAAMYLGGWYSTSNSYWGGDKMNWAISYQVIEEFPIYKAIHFRFQFDGGASNGLLDGIEFDGTDLVPGLGISFVQKFGPLRIFAGAEANYHIVSVNSQESMEIDASSTITTRGGWKIDENRFGNAYFAGLGIMLSPSVGIYTQIAEGIPSEISIGLVF